MENKIKINVVVGGRSYPLHVNNANEEEGTRKAAEKINKLILNFEENYAVSDKQDVLAMCALQFASKLEITNIVDQENELKAKEKIEKMHQLLDVNLK
ncbi:cell division protein ZapA [Flavicella sp.]|uniref:cell division protein ZapA n=1 Tax=Flavicella sp. TaxID=2957742 RepID=UPI0030164BE0